MKVQGDAPVRATAVPQEKKEMPKKSTGRTSDQRRRRSSTSAPPKACKGQHWVKDRPSRTETQRKEVQDLLQEKNSKKKRMAKTPARCLSG
ncbi:hypothetical protein V7S43_007410 [Phytophthora oleae]|uniref:Uncharacterized protein n=1 Tax=Phytophthora oleae TaxID=2107226 RepID=A0ABD3FLS9_9STRA